MRISTYRSWKMWKLVSRWSYHRQWSGRGHGLALNNLSDKYDNLKEEMLKSSTIWSKSSVQVSHHLRELAKLEYLWSEYNWHRVVASIQYIQHKWLMSFTMCTKQVETRDTKIDSLKKIAMLTRERDIKHCIHAEIWLSAQARSLAVMSTKTDSFGANLS